MLWVIHTCNPFRVQTENSPRTPRQLSNLVFIYIYNTCVQSCRRYIGAILFQFRQKTDLELLARELYIIYKLSLYKVQPDACLNES